MASPGFQLDPSLANLPPDLLRKKYDELTPEQRQLLGFTRPASQAEFDAAQQNQGGGAPIDFGGRVIPNPNGVQVSSDTDPGIPPLRLPNGVSASVGPYNGTPKLDTSNPAQADVMQPAMQTVQSGWTPVKESAADTSAWTPVQESKAEPAKTAEPSTGTFSERNPALMSGLAKHDPKFAHDIDEVEGMLEGTIKSIYQTTTPGVVASLVKEHPSLAKYIPDAMLRDAAEKKDLPKQAALTLLGTMTGEPSEVEPGAIKPVEAVKPSAASDLASRIGSAAKDRLAKAALKFAARRIPGVHLASDVASFASDVLKPTEQMPVATAPKGPVGPPELWGKTITPEVAPQNAAAARTQPQTAPAPKSDPYSTDAPDMRVKNAMRTRAEITEDQAIQDQVRNADYSDPKTRPTVDQALSVLPEAIGQGAGTVVGGKLAEVAAPKVVAAAGKGMEAVKDAAGSAAKAVKPTLSTAGKVATTVGKSLDPDVVGLVSPRAAHALRLSAKVGKVASKLGTEASLDATPENEAYAGETEPAPTPNAPAARTQTATPAKMEQLLNEATGGRPLQPNVSLKNQAAVRAGAAPSSGLPEGFTPVKSSALKGYKYNPETQELESITSNGGHYIHGDVSPEQFSALESAASKGKAWSDLKSQSTYVGKMVNGKRVNAVPPSALKSATPESTPPGEAPANAAAARAQGKPTAQAAPDEDLTGILQKSVDQAKKQGVMTTADPEMLTKRWGVTEQSLKSAREQTRGWTPMETDAELSRMTERYRKGDPVEPVMETRDENNNLVDVDGRGRAIAAQRAGIKRIPIIVRRMNVAQAK